MTTKDTLAHDDVMIDCNDAMIDCNDSLLLRAHCEHISTEKRVLLLLEVSMPFLLSADVLIDSIVYPNPVRDRR